MQTYLREQGSAHAGRAIEEFYCCPEGMLDLRVKGSLSEAQGYFRVAEETVCYGRCADGVSPEPPGHRLPQGSEARRDGTASLCLSFDPSEVLENLRRERYPHRQLSGWEGVMKSLYYTLRPLTTLEIRRRVQQFHARRARNIAFPKWPIDTTVENLCQSVLRAVLATRAIERLPFIWFWPRGQSGCVMMTHDVETRRGLDSCENLLKLNDSFGIRAAFQLVPEGRYEIPQSLLASIRAHGSEVGIQDLNHDGRLFDEEAEFLRRAERIRRYAEEFGAEGFRSAILYRNQDWLDALGFAYDMSVPNVAHLDPQLGGCCTVMPYFAGNTLELPVTTVQDYTLFHLLNERSIGLWEQQTDCILAKNGMASFIVHPDYIQEADTRRIYEALLRRLTQLRESLSLWFALPREVNAWWRQRSQMTLVRDGRGWRAEGEGAQEAVVAYASMADGRLIYQVGEQVVVA